MRLIFLSDKFYLEHAGHTEILQKRTRPYVCLAIKIGDVTFAVPFRHHIAHKYAFFTYDDCGLDYTKSVVIADESLIGKGTPQVDQAEFNAIKGKERSIHNGLARYVELYKKAAFNRGNRHYENIVRYSSLQYFEKYL